MSRCPLRCCSECREELCQEQIIQKSEVRRIDTCSCGPTPEVNHDLEDDSESASEQTPFHRRRRSDSS